VKFLQGFVTATAAVIVILIAMIVVTGLVKVLMHLLGSGI
jgi:hypothetical protein